MSILLLRIRQCLGWSGDSTQESFHCHSAARKLFFANWRMKIRYLRSIIQSYLFVNAHQFGVKVILGKVGRESYFFNLINSWSDLDPCWSFWETSLALAKVANDSNRSMVSSRDNQFTSWYIQKFLSASTLHKCLSPDPEYGESRTLKAFTRVCHTGPYKNKTTLKKIQLAITAKETIKS